MYVARQGGLAGAIQVSGLLLNYVLAVFVARLTGAAGLGLLVLGLAFATAASLATTFGLTYAMVRYVAASLASGSGREASGIFVFSAITVATAATLLGSGIYLAAPDFGTGTQTTDAIRIVAIVIPFISLGEISRGCLRGLSSIQLAQTIEDIVFPLVIGIALGAILLFHSSTSRTPLIALAFAYVVCGCMSFLPAALNVRSLHATPLYRIREWLGFALPVGLNSALLFCLSWGSQIILGVMTSAAQVGIYASAVRFASLVILPIFAINTVFLPTIAALHSTHNHDRLQMIYSGLTLIETAAGLAIAAVIALVGPIGLATFGSAFRGGYSTLLILLVGYVINAGTGSSGAVLMMTGRTGFLLFDTALAASVTLSLSVLLIPEYGSRGAAVATATAMATINLLQVVQVRRLLGLRAYAWSQPLERIAAILRARRAEGVD